MNDLVHWKIPIGEPFLFGEIIIQSFPQLRGTAIDHCSTYLTIASAVLCCVLLYIPLYFFFIVRINAQGVVSFVFTFHYASTLSRASYPFEYYPPFFTFYYASTLSRLVLLVLSSLFLYIPLCFYFIWWIRQRYINSSAFTFHYASTLSDR